LHVIEVGGYRELAILPGHTTCHNPIGAPLVKPVERLNGDDQPLSASRDGLQSLELDIRIFPVSVKSDEQTPWVGGLRRDYQIPSMCGDCDGSFQHLRVHVWRSHVTIGIQG